MTDLEVKQMAVNKAERIERSPFPTEQPSMSDIRAVLWESVLLLRTEEKSPATANAQANQIGKYLSTIRLEMDYNRQAGRKLVIPMLEPGEAHTTEQLVPPQENGDTAEG
jgi:hypothetical protein